MYSIHETPTFKKLVDALLTSEERQEFCVFIASHPEAGDLIPGSGGCRKVRWSRQGMGKRGGVRIIYYNTLESGEIHLLLIYAKAVSENIPAHILKQIKEEIEK